MTTELVILFAVSIFLAVGFFVGTDNKPSALRSTLQQSAPRLGARLEREIETGAGFAEASRTRGISDPIGWTYSN